MQYITIHTTLHYTQPRIATQNYLSSVSWSEIMKRVADDTNFGTYLRTCTIREYLNPNITAVMEISNSC